MSLTVFDCFKDQVLRGGLLMRRRWEQVAGALLLLAFALACVFVYQSYVEIKIYDECSEQLLTTYKQVDNSFEMFCQRNWNILENWDTSIAEMPDENRITSLWSEAHTRKNSWGYTVAYVFNERNQYVTDGEKTGVAQSINGVFEEMYKTDGPVVSSYISSNGKRRVVFARPLKKALTIDGIEYTGVALCYNNATVSDIIASDVFNGQSDCYVIQSNGHVVLSLQPKSEFTSFIANLYDFMEKNETFERSSLAEFKRGIKQGKSGSALCTADGVSHYLVYQPAGLNNWTIVGVVRSNAVEQGMEDVRNVTVAALGVTFVVAAALVVGVVVTREHDRVKAKERERREIERQKALTEQLFQGVSSVVDRFAVVDLVADTYEYHEHVAEKPLYPKTGSYRDLIDATSARYAILTDTGDAKLSHVLDPDRLRERIKPSDPIHKFEYTGRNEDVYKVMNIVPLAWDEEGKLARALLVSQDIGQKIELQTMANTDGLTGLFNERYFSSRLAVKERIGEQFVLFYLDLDRFKPVNDSYGHDVGDKLLKAVAKRLLKCTRSCDLAFRIGGDEFALIVANGLSDSACEALAERIDRSMHEPFVVDGKVITVGASCGWARHPEEGTASEVRVIADQRMYNSKRRHHAVR